MKLNFNRVITLVDFTGVSKLAIEHTALIARGSLCLVTLLHIAPMEKSGEEINIKREIREFASHLESEGVSFSVQINFGNFFDIIQQSIKALHSDLIIIGTHGIRGIKQNFVSTNICKLIHLIDIPALVIQGHSIVPQEGYSSLMLPSRGIQNLDLLTEPIRKMASIFSSTLLFLTHFNSENQAQLKENSIFYTKAMNELGIKSTYQLEENGIFKNNFSKDIIELADIEQITLICLIFHEQGGNLIFEEEDLENILLNRIGVPVLCF